MTVKQNKERFSTVQMIVAHFSSLLSFSLPLTSMLTKTTARGWLSHQAGQGLFVQFISSLPH